MSPTFSPAAIIFCHPRYGGDDGVTCHVIAVDSKTEQVMMMAMITMMVVVMMIA